MVATFQGRVSVSKLTAKTYLKISNMEKVNEKVKEHYQVEISGRFSAF
jgi:hypothetical protein